METYCFYHSADLDGHCSGAIVKWMRHPADTIMIPINYGDSFPWDTVQGQRVFMVDFSLQPFDDMLRLEHETEELIWIDHHKSAIESWSAAGSPDIQGIRVVGEAGCELSWRWFSKQPPPEAVRLLGRYDVWDHTDPKTLPFQYRMRLEPSDPKNVQYWEDVFKWGADTIHRMAEEGHLILKFIASENEKYARACAFDVELDGLKCIAINKGLTNSQLFDSIWRPMEYEAMLTFSWQKDKWVVSLYSDRDDIDVSVVAKGRGGGGHKGAAGFQCKELPLELPARK